MDLQSIIFLTFGFFEKNFLESIAETVQEEFGIQVILKEVHFDLSDYYDPNRRQYNGNELLKEVDSMNASVEAKAMGLFNVDLFIPILTYIFGQAQLGGRSGIASIYRLGNERYGMKPDAVLLRDRFAKEIIHELGHLFGLVHCHTPGCVMMPSTYVEDIDQKEARFCPKCRGLAGF